jgi:hypothetical protein
MQKFVEVSYCRQLLYQVLVQGMPVWPSSVLSYIFVMKIVIKSRDSSISMSREEHKMGACTSIDSDTVDRYSSVRPHNDVRAKGIVSKDELDNA